MMGHKLLVHIVRAEGLQQMNHFTGDHPYCVCEVKHSDSHAHPTKAETKPVSTGDTLNPIWDEAFEIDPWQEGEALEFTIYDKGLLGAKTEGRVELPADAFFPTGFNGMLSISDIPGALLQVEVQILGGPAEQAVPTVMHPVAGDSSMTTYTMPSTTYSYGAPAPSVYSTQTVTYPQAPQVMYQATSSAAGSITYGAPSASVITGAPNVLSAAAPMTYTSTPAVTYSMPQAQAGVVQGAQTGVVGTSMGPSVSTGPQRLAVSILQAHGLQHMNHFTGDHPYCTCEVKHTHQHTSMTKIETKTVADGDVLNPFWGETHQLEPWHPGESLEFTVYDKGLMGSKTEGKIVLPSDFFFPQGFSGMLQISGCPHALLHVIVRPLGQSGAGSTEAVTTVEGATKSKKKKLKLGKKSKGCC